MKRTFFVLLCLLLCAATVACNETPAVTTGESDKPGTTGTLTEADTTKEDTTKEDDTMPEDDSTIGISIFWEPPADFTNAESYDLIAGAGITNVEMTNRNSWQVEGNPEKILELCAERGLTATLHTATTDSFTNMSLRQIMNYVEQYKDNPTVSGYYIVDEPASPISYSKAYQALLAADPDCLPALNLLPYFATWVFENYNGYVEDFIVSVGKDKLKELCYDQYPFPYSKGSKPTNIYYNLDLFRKIGLKYGVDTSFYIQSIGESGNFRRPTGDEIRFHVSSGLAYGIKHYKYFTWWTTGYCDEKDYAIISPYGEVTDIYDDVKDINADTAAAGKILVKLDALEVYHTKSGYDSTVLLPGSSPIKAGGGDFIVSFMQHRTTGRDYIMLVNKNYKKAVTETFTLEGISELYNASTGEYVPLDISSGSVTLDFKAGGFVLLAVGANDDIVDIVYDSDARNLAKDKAVFSDFVQSSNGYYAYCVTDGIRGGNDATALGWRCTGDRYIEVDLSREVSFNRVDLYATGTDYTLGQSFPSAFRILCSNDRENYTELYSAAGYDATKATPSITFDGVTARYLKIELVGGGEIAEIEIYNDDGSVPKPDDSHYGTAGGEASGTNIAKGRPVTVSSSLERSDWGWSYKFVNDGKLRGDSYGGWTSMTGVNSAPDAPEWVCVDLCCEYSLDRVVLYPRQVSDGCMYFPEEYEIQVSSDGVNFTTVKTISETRADSSAVTVELDGVSARYVRVYTLKLTKPEGTNDGYLFQLAELEVYNK